MERGSTVGIVLTSLMVMAVVMCMVHILRKLAWQIGLIDEPDARKRHEGQVPLVGGLAIFIGFCVGLSLIHPPWERFPALITGGFLLVVIGMLDDLQELSKRVRFLGQVVAALLLSLVGGIMLKDLGWLSFGELLPLGVLAIPFTIFCTVGVLNAVNMSDGLDGLAGGLVLITLGSLAYLAYDAGVTRDLDVLMVLMACVVGFLVFNARSPWCKQANIFMGDAGSLFLGFAVAYFLIDFSQGDSRIIHPVTALWIFAVPLMDTVRVMLRRFIAGRSPFSGDRQHLHHVLLAAGYSVKHTTMLIWAISLLLAITGIVGYSAQVSDGVMLLGFLGLFGVYMRALVYLAKLVWIEEQITETATTSTTTSIASLWPPPSRQKENAYDGLKQRDSGN